MFNVIPNVQTKNTAVHSAGRNLTKNFILPIFRRYIDDVATCIISIDCSVQQSVN